MNRDRLINGITQLKIPYLITSDPSFALFARTLINRKSLRKTACSVGSSLHRSCLFRSYHSNVCTRWIDKQKKEITNDRNFCHVNSITVIKRFSYRKCAASETIGTRQRRYLLCWIRTHISDASISHGPTHFTFQAAKFIKKEPREHNERRVKNIQWSMAN